MYILVHHSIRDPLAFWSTADQVLNMPPGLQMHHAFSARNGTHAACLWEADSVEEVRNFLEPILSRFSNNEYAEAENREGIALPTQVPGFVPPEQPA